MKNAVHSDTDAMVQFQDGMCDAIPECTGEADDIETYVVDRLEHRRNGIARGTSVCYLVDE